MNHEDKRELSRTVAFWLRLQAAPEADVNRRFVGSQNEPEIECLKKGTRETTMVVSLVVALKHCKSRSVC